MVHVLEHGALGGAQLADALDVAHHLLVPVLDLVKKAADTVQGDLGGIQHLGDLGLDVGGAVGGVDDLVEHLGGLLDLLDALPQGLAGTANAVAEAVGAVLHRLDAGLHLGDEFLDLVGQLLHLGGHHREALALLPGPGSLNGGVDGQDVGLVGDGDDLAHALFDLADVPLEPGEGGVHLAKVGLHLLGDVLQFLHLPLGLEHRLGDLGLDAGEGIGDLADAGEVVLEVLQLCLEHHRFTEHPVKGTAHQAQFPQGVHLLLHQLLLVVPQAVGDVQDGGQVLLTPGLGRRGLFAWVLLKKAHIPSSFTQTPRRTWTG